MGKKDDDLEKEVKEALKKDKDSEPVKKAGKSSIVKRALEAKYGKGSQN